ncbi:MAG TPA: 1,4-dihydroxy-6-naphthoate synthase [Micromonosporaceae bacterium]|nr:1,4-dihydroxy-6-naphthoate synthase [Micromonosporaceae bacterium]
MKIAFSPCPNDTFVFHALVHGLIDGTPEFEVTYADVDVTNTAALDGDFDIVKVSYAALPWLLDQYELLPCGGALGRGCGPLVVAKPGATVRKVAVPGDRTTAYLLFRLWAKETYEIEVVPFHEIMPGVAAGRFDAGLVIHEARFTYQTYGLVKIVDLGEWWEEDTGLPIPLGAILAKPAIKSQATQWIRESVKMAWADPQTSRAYVHEHAQEMQQSVQEQHIALYVNEFTESLGEQGYEAARNLLARAASAGITPAVDI